MDVYCKSILCKKFVHLCPESASRRWRPTPAALSYLAYVAAISKVVQSEATYPRQHSPTSPYVAAISKVVQSSTIDDAIFYDHGMRSGRLTFDQQGRRVTREATATEQKAIRRHIWLVRNTTEIPVREELVEMMKQVRDWPATCAVERTVTQIRFASGSEPVKLPVGLRLGIANESTNLKAEADACAITYAHCLGIKSALSTEPWPM